MTPAERRVFERAVATVRALAGRFPTAAAPWARDEYHATVEPRERVAVQKAERRPRLRAVRP